MNRKKQPITSMLGLLTALYVDVWSGPKTLAVLHWDRDRTIDNENWYVREHFDDGRGHSGAFSSEDTPVSKDIFAEAKKGCFVEGCLLPGYVSETEFKLSDLGRKEYFRLVAEEKKK